MNFSSVGILTWARDLELQALPVEDLVVVESGRGGIETDLLSGSHLVVFRSSLMCPIEAFLKSCDLVLRAYVRLFIDVDISSILTVSWHLISPLALLRLEDPNTRVLCRVACGKSIDGGSKHCVWHLFL